MGMVRAVEGNSYVLLSFMVSTVKYTATHTPLSPTYARNNEIGAQCYSPYAPTAVNLIGPFLGASPFPTRYFSLTPMAANSTSKNFSAPGTTTCVV